MSVKLFDNVHHEISSIDNILEDVVTSDRRLSWFNLKINFLQGLGAFSLIASMLAALIFGLQNEWVSAGDFALVLTLSISFAWGVHDMGKQMQRYSKVVGTCNQALSIIKLPHEIKDRPEAIPLNVHRGEIRFQDVSFHYENRTNLFENLTITLNPDEATSSLDSKTEDEIHKALHEVMSDKTVIVIAHRLSTLKEMDRILVFVEGKVVEDGSLNQLLENKNGHFYKLWQMQVNGFIS